MPVTNTPDWPQSRPGSPLISILIAARNEEHAILTCLEAVNRLNYPTDQLEVLIGNDQSTDQTATLVAGFIQDKPAFQLMDIRESVSGLRGKANVLAQLANQARGQLFFLPMPIRRFLPTG